MGKDIFVVEEFVSETDNARLIEIINEQEESGMLYRNNNSGPLDDGRLMLWNTDNKEFWGIVKKYLKNVVKEYGQDLHPHDVAMLKYYPGKGMSLHTDQDGPCAGKCKLTSVIYLNDDYEGGEVIFPFIKKSFKLKERSVMYFEQDGIEAFHEIGEILDGNRYAIITCYTDDGSMLREVHKDFRS